jgi:hypothetical protein
MGLDLFSYIDDREKITVSLFKQFELDRLKNTKYPFYDGGLTPVILYYNLKYELDIKYKSLKELQTIEGTTLFQICKKFYDSSSIKPALIVPTEVGVNDLFEEEFLKKYYFNTGFYNFEEVLIKFRDIKKENEKNDDGTYEWVMEIKNIILAMLALKENYKMGFKEKNQYDKYLIYIKETVEEFLNEYPDKSSVLYIINFWIYQLLVPESPAVKINGYNVLFSLFKKYFSSDPNKLLMIDENSQINNYFYNWITLTNFSPGGRKWIHIVNVNAVIKK